MKKIIISLIVVAVILLSGIVAILAIFFNSSTQSEISSNAETLLNDPSELNEGFYIKKGNNFYPINENQEYAELMGYLVVSNECYYDELVMEDGDELIFVSDDREVSTADVKYYDDLNFPTIGAFFTSSPGDYRHVRDEIESANAISNYNEITKIDGKPINDLIEYKYFIGGLSEDSEYTVSCLEGTKTKNVTGKADCHLLMDTIVGFRDSAAEADWILSDSGYVVLNKNFINYKDDKISGFNQSGFYELTMSIQKSNASASSGFRSFLIKYKK